MSEDSGSYANHEEDGVDLFSGVQDIIEQIGPANIDLVIEGETGVGKNTLARKIHDMSAREGDYIAVNCTAIPEAVAESEFFEILSGVDSSAEKSRCGPIDVSKKGTLYLDEIDSMPLSQQAKLLRMLEMKGVARPGAADILSMDLRVIASTRVPLEVLVEKKRFRKDLFYRLNIVKIQLPTLRSMPDMIIPLFKQFVRQAAGKFKREMFDIDESVYMGLLAHDWPGNARELKTAAERCVLGMPPISNGTRVGEAGIDHRWSLKRRLEKVEKLWIESALLRHKGCMDNVVSELCVPKRTLYYRMKKLNISY